jgi:hypothetical protein
MGGAFIAIADDASAVSWNPGGLAQLLDRQVTFAASANDYETKTTGNQSLLDSPLEGRIRVLSDDSAFVGDDAGLDFAALVLPFDVGSRGFVGSLSYLRDQRAVRGRGPLVIRYFQAPPGEPAEQPVGLEEIDEHVSGAGGLDSFALGLATSFGSLHVGAAVHYHRGDVRLSSEDRVRFTSLVDEAGEPSVGVRSDYVESEASTWPVRAFSVNLGALWKPLTWLSVGAAYRSGWTSAEPYALHYRTVGYDESLIPDGRYFDLSTTVTERVELRFPDSFGGGVAVRPVPPLTVSFDATWTRWSEARINGVPYVERVSGPECPPECLVVSQEDILYPSEAPAESNLQRDQLALRLGAEYVFRPGRIVVPLRAGVYRLPAIAPLFADRIGDTGLHFDTDPETDFTGLTAGIGVVMPIGGSARLLLDLAAIVETAESGWRQTQEVDDAGATLTSTADRSIRNRRIVASAIVYF